MADILDALQGQVAWPAALMLAWLAGELAARWFRLPRISSYGLMGILLAAQQGAFLPAPQGGAVAMLADFAFALMLFELGYRINLRWLTTNPWLGLTSVLEAGASFAAVFGVARLFGMELQQALVLAVLAMATSPAEVLRVANELKGAGQVTERTLHLCAFNCLYSVVIFKAVVAYEMISSAATVFQALWHSLVVVVVSATLGALSGVALPALLRALGGMPRSATLAFALAVLLLTAFNHAFHFSPVMAALAFGLAARHRRVVLSQAQRNFGTLGDLLTVLLFVFAAASLNWNHVLTSARLALAVIAARGVAKLLAATLLARPAGLSGRKGALVGAALTPMSIFAMMLLQQTRHLQLPMLNDMAGFAAIALLLLVFGPIATQWALRRAGETDA